MNIKAELGINPNPNQYGGQVPLSEKIYSILDVDGFEEYQKEHMKVKQNLRRHPEKGRELDRGEKESIRERWSCM